MPILWQDDDDDKAPALPGLEEVRKTENPQPAEPPPPADFQLTSEVIAPGQLTLQLSIRATFGAKRKPNA